MKQESSKQNGPRHAANPARRAGIGAITSALVAVSAGILGFEVIAHFWFSDDVLEQTPIWFRFSMSIFVLLAAMLAIWRIFRHTPAMITSTLSEEQWLEGARPTKLDRLRNYAEWFILMRWIAVVVAAVLVFLVVRVAGLLPHETYWPLLVIILGLAGLNIVFAQFHRRGFMQGVLLKLQVAGDLIILTGLLHFSGGIENQFSLIMLLHVIIGGIILSRGECYGVAALGSVLFGVLALLELSHVLEHYALLVFPHGQTEEGVEHAAHEPLYAYSRIVGHAAILFLTALFVTTLAERQRHDERQLVRMADRALAEGLLLDQSLETTGTALRVIDDRLRTQWSNGRWKAWFENPDPILEYQEVLNGPQSSAQQTIGDMQTRSRIISTPDQHVPKQHFQITTAVLPGADLHGMRVVELAQDITDQKKAEAQLIRAGQLAAVGELAGQVAHEVNNPIAIISAKARLQLSDHRHEMSQETAEEFEKIVSLADRVAGIAQGLLSYCRPSSAARVPIDIRLSLQSAVSMIERRVAKAGIELILDAENLPAVVANAQELEQVLLNLLLNAIDAMPEGGTLKISASVDDATADQQDRYLSLLVEDSGGGIPREIMDRIFEPFFTTKEPGKGTGLGLSICQGLIRSHGGEIEVESEVGRGTRITVKLPVGTMS